jgi:hypothetical protein
MRYFNVTQSMIDQGLAKRACRCPLALGLKAIPGVVQAWVHDDLIRVDVMDEGQARTITFPPTTAMRRFMRRFDDHRLLGPTRFRVPATLCV